MAQIIQFTKLKIGEIVKVDVEGTMTRCRVLSHEGKDTYRLKAVEGPYKGYSAFYKVSSIIRP